MGSSRVRYPYVAVVVVVVVIAIGIAVKVRSGQAARAEHVRQASATLNSAKAARARVSSLAARANAAGGSFEAARADALAAGEARHDASSIDAKYSQAKREQQDVEAMSSIISKFVSLGNDELDVFESRFPSSTNTARSLLKSLELSRLEETRTWDEAISGITDSLRAAVGGNFGYSSGDPSASPSLCASASRAIRCCSLSDPRPLR
jgi:hypothetical protein